MKMSISGIMRMPRGRKGPELIALLEDEFEDALSDAYREAAKGRIPDFTGELVAAFQEGADELDAGTVSGIAPSRGSQLRGRMFKGPGRGRARTTAQLSKRNFTLSIDLPQIAFDTSRIIGGRSYGAVPAGGWKFQQTFERLAQIFFEQNMTALKVEDIITTSPTIRF